MVNSRFFLMDSSFINNRLQRHNDGATFWEESNLKAKLERLSASLRIHKTIRRHQLDLGCQFFHASICEVLTPRWEDHGVVTNKDIFLLGSFVERTRVNIGTEILESMLDVRARRKPMTHPLLITKMLRFFQIPKGPFVEPPVIYNTQGFCCGTRMVEEYIQREPQHNPFEERATIADNMLF